MVIFGSKPWVNPFQKNGHFSNFSTSCLYSLERPIFVLEYLKRHFPGLYYLKKKRLGKMAIFGPKPWVNPFGKIAIFLNFSTSSLYSLERRIFVLEYLKRHFPGLYFLKKKTWKNGHFWTKTQGQLFWKKVIFSSLKLLVFIAQKGVFSFQYIVKDIFLAYIP